MTIDEIKQTIEKETGLPSGLLTGETLEENIAQAKALLLYKGQKAPDTSQKTTAQQFAEWAGGVMDPGDALGNLAGSDNPPSGSETGAGDDQGKKSTAQLFAEWANARF